MSRATTWGARLALLAALACAGCAWANRDNRPVWNAFEENWVPEDESMVWVSAPLTVPAGLVAIVLDIFIVHPVQVMDDAWGDTGDLWDEIDWEADYYSECALSVLRVPWSVITLVGSFVGRSLFDIPPWDGDDGPEHVEPPTPPEEPADAELEAGFLAWLQELIDDPEGPGAQLSPPWLRTWNARLDAAVQRVLEHGAPVARLRLRSVAAGRYGDHQLPPFRDGGAEVWLDADPRVRLALLQGPDAMHLARGSAELREALRNDPDPVVRAVAREVLR